MWDLVSAGLDGRPATVLDAGSVSGTCGFAHPFAVSAAASASLDYVRSGTQPGQDECDAPTASQFVRDDPRTGEARAATSVGGTVADAATDGATTYWLRKTVGASTDCDDPAGTCTLVASTELPLGATASHAGIVDADTDPTKRAGYRWVTAGGVRLLKPPATLPCAPSAQTTYLLASARWSRGRHTVQAKRTDPDGTTRHVGVAITRSLPTGSRCRPSCCAAGSARRSARSSTAAASRPSGCAAGEATGPASPPSDSNR